MLRMPEKPVISNTSPLVCLWGLDLLYLLRELYTEVEYPPQIILCSPYDESNAHWIYDTQTGEAIRQPGRRDAGYWYKTQRTGSKQLSLFREEKWDDLHRCQ